MSANTRHSFAGVFVFTASLLIAVLLPVSGIAEGLPPGLSDMDPMVRLLAVQEVEKTGLVSAVPRIAEMAKEDTFDAVREAACKALQTLKATGRIELLSEIAANDSNANVRAAAAEAVKGLGGLLLEDDNQEKSAVRVFRPKRDVRHLAIGLGSMGGFGIVALDLRGRIPTGISILPWIGIEIGGGWTPPSLYVVTAGPVDNTSNDDHRLQLFNAIGGVLLYPAKMHYAAVRGGFDIARGGYGVLAYGLEVLTRNGLFSWGVEAGILIQPAIKKYIDNLCEGEVCDEELWPVIPCVRFSVQLYPV